MCGGFNCLKNALITLNILYVAVGAILIYVSWSGKLTSPYSDDFPVATGIEICGTFLICLAILGIIGAIKHHQVILFFYMIILFILFVAQLGFSYASMNMSNDQQKNFAKQCWDNMSPESQIRFQRDYRCCSYSNPFKPSDNSLNSSSCYNNPCCDKSSITCDCPTCEENLESKIRFVFKLAGQLGMFFSFTEIFGVWLTKRYRNQKDPRSHPSAFL